jgi:DNA-binding MarR family transcriptional regulator
MGAPPAIDQSFRFLRYCHIFASAVREVLELSPLRASSPLPLTLPQFHLLKLMAIDGRHQPGKAADILGVSRPAATRSIDKLERLGLVVRGPAKGDRRATLLSLSPKGRRLVRRYEELKAARLTPALASFRPKEVEQLARLLERFSVSLLVLGQAQREHCLRCAAYLEDDCPVGHSRGGCPHQGLHAARPGSDAVGES